MHSVNELNAFILGIRGKIYIQLTFYLKIKIDITLTL